MTMQAEHRHAKALGAHGFPHPSIPALSSTACPNEKTLERRDPAEDNVPQRLASA